MTTRRTRTPSDVKWLVNELAAVNGELAQIDEEMARLAARRERLQGLHAGLSKTAALVGEHGLLAELPGVRAHPARGGRGAIVEFFRDTLRAAHPQAVDTHVMTRLALRRFGLEPATPQERDKFRRGTVTHTLRRLYASGEVERLHDLQAAPNGLGVWRWKVDQPTLADLAEMAGLAEMPRLSQETAEEAV